MSRLYRSVLALLLFSMSACAQGSTIPDDRTTSTLPVSMVQTQTEAARASPTPLATFTPAALPTFPLPTVLPTFSLPFVTPTITSTTTATPTAVRLPANFSPVLWKGYGEWTAFALLGGVQAGKWLSVDETVAQITGASQYDVYTFTNGMHTVYGYAPVKANPFSPGYYIGMDDRLSEIDRVGVAHGWQVTQRAVDELLFQNDGYQKVITDWLSQAGVADPQTGTMHIYRVDLEGDGTDEIIITDTRVESQHTAKAGDHSVILMRKISGNETVTIPILVDLYAYAKQGSLNPFPCTYSIENFIDLNQDGILEVFVKFDRWEGFGVSVHQVKGEKVEQVLGMTCIN